MEHHMSSAEKSDEELYANLDSLLQFLEVIPNLPALAYLNLDNDLYFNNASKA